MNNTKKEINGENLDLALGRLRIAILSGKVSQSKRAELMGLYDDVLAVLGGKDINKDSAYDAFVKGFGPKLKSKHIPRIFKKNKKDSDYVHPHRK